MEKSSSEEPVSTHGRLGGGVAATFLLPRLVKVQFRHESQSGTTTAGTRPISDEMGKCNNKPS